VAPGTRLKVGLSDQGPTTAIAGAEVPVTDVPSRDFP
jgi:hypothetical protein